MCSKKILMLMSKYFQGFVRLLFHHLSLFCISLIVAFFIWSPFYKKYKCIFKRHNKYQLSQSMKNQDDIIKKLNSISGSLYIRRGANGKQYYQEMFNAPAVANAFSQKIKQIKQESKDKVKQLLQKELNKIQGGKDFQLLREKIQNKKILHENEIQKMKDPFIQEIASFYSKLWLKVHNEGSFWQGAAVLLDDKKLTQQQRKNKAKESEERQHTIQIRVKQATEDFECLREKILNKKVFYSGQIYKLKNPFVRQIANFYQQVLHKIHKKDGFWEGAIGILNDSSFTIITHYLSRGLFTSYYEYMEKKKTINKQYQVLVRDYLQFNKVKQSLKQMLGNKYKQDVTKSLISQQLADICSQIQSTIREKGNQIHRNMGRQGTLRKLTFQALFSLISLEANQTQKYAEKQCESSVISEIEKNLQRVARMNVDQFINQFGQWKNDSKKNVIYKTVQTTLDLVEKMLQIPYGESLHAYINKLKVLKSEEESRTLEVQNLKEKLKKYSIDQSDSQKMEEQVKELEKKLKIQIQKLAKEQKQNELFKQKQEQLQRQVKNMAKALEEGESVKRQNNKLKQEIQHLKNEITNNKREKNQKINNKSQKGSEMELNLQNKKSAKQEDNKSQKGSEMELNLQNKKSSKQEDNKSQKGSEMELNLQNKKSSKQEDNKSQNGSEMELNLQNKKSSKQEDNKSQNGSEMELNLQNKKSSKQEDNKSQKGSEMELNLQNKKSSKQEDNKSQNGSEMELNLQNKKSSKQEDNKSQKGSEMELNLQNKKSSKQEDNKSQNGSEMELNLQNKKSSKQEDNKSQNGSEMELNLQNKKSSKQEDNKSQKGSEMELNLQNKKSSKQEDNKSQNGSEMELNLQNKKSSKQEDNKSQKGSDFRQCLDEELQKFQHDPQEIIKKLRQNIVRLQTKINELNEVIKNLQKQNGVQKDQTGRQEIRYQNSKNQIKNYQMNDQYKKFRQFLQILQQKLKISELPELYKFQNEIEKKLDRLIKFEQQTIMNSEQQNYVFTKLEQFFDKKLKCIVCLTKSGKHELPPKRIHLLRRPQNLIVFRIKETQNVVACYSSMSYCGTLDMRSNKGGLLMDINQKRSFPLKKGQNPVTPDEQSIIFGNGQVVFHSEQLEIESYETSDAYDLRGVTLQDIFDSKNLTNIKIQEYAVYQVYFEQQEEIRNVQKLNKRQKRQRGRPENKQISPLKYPHLNEQQINEIKKQVEKLKVMLQQKEKYIKDLQANDKISKEQKMQLKKAQQRVISLEDQVTLEKEKFLKLKKEFQKQKKEIALNSREVIGLRNKSNAIDQLKEQLKIQKEKVQQLKKELKKAKEEGESLKEVQKTLLQKILNLKDELERKQAINNRNKSILELKNKQLAELKEKTKTAQKQENSYKILQKSCAQKDEKINSLQNQLYEIKKMQPRSSPTKPFLPKHAQENKNKLKVQQAKWNIKLDQYLFEGNVLEPKDIEDRTFVRECLQRSMNMRVVKTRPVYDYPRMKNFNFHQFIDNKRNYLVLVKLTNNWTIAAFSEEPLIKGGPVNRGNGFLASITKRQIFELDRQNPQSKLTIYDNYFILFGNSELKIKINDLKIDSNLGIVHRYFKTGGHKSPNVLFGIEDRSFLMDCYEVFEVEFEYFA